MQSLYCKYKYKPCNNFINSLPYKYNPENKVNCIFFLKKHKGCFEFWPLVPMLENNRKKN